MSAQQDQSQLWTHQTWPFLASVMALMTCIAFESFAITTVLPVAMSELDGQRWYAFAFAATIVTGLIGMIIGGDWSDRSGPRRPLLIGGAIFSVGVALCVLAPHVLTFIIGRLLQGVGGGIVSVVLYVLIARQIPEAARPRMCGLLTAACLIPAMAGPLLGRRALLAVLATGCLTLPGKSSGCPAQQRPGDPARWACQARCVSCPEAS